MITALLAPPQFRRILTATGLLLDSLPGMVALARLILVSPSYVIGFGTGSHLLTVSAGKLWRALLSPLSLSLSRSAEGGMLAALVSVIWQLLSALFCAVLRLPHCLGDRLVAGMQILLSLGMF